MSKASNSFSTASNKVVSMHAFRSDATASQSVEYPASNEVNTDVIRKVIDTVLVELSLNAALAAYTSSNPFDAIYLSALRPDTFGAGTINDLYKYKNIKDLSEDISFNDYWED